MQQEALLTALAEIGATFMGFSALVSVFRRGESIKQSDPQLFEVRDIVEISLTVTIFALVPFVAHGLGLSEQLVWRASSALYSVAWLTAIAFSFRRLQVLRSLEHPPDPPRLAMIVGGICTVSAQSLLWFNVVRSEPHPTLYSVSLILHLAVAGLWFVLILIPPRQ